ncbi:DUF6221 family protein [Streptomyces sp. NBC_00101]|uniref:DUF6221 family protein n=1 Tax=Streptomyces sp. NBC_00101 TaxID=2975651 RepID=UPI00324A5005
MTAGLVQFLRARLDEDEAAARAADDELSNVFTRIEVFDAEMAADERHIMQHRPAQVLREVEAKRRIVDAHGPDHECISLTGSGDASVVDGKPWALWELEHTGDAEQPCFILRCLALPHADHPAYLPEWRP